MRVRLILTSEQLSFLATTFAEGSCVPVNDERSAEDCQLTLSRPTTVVRVPVVVRAPGAFPLSLQVETPSGAKVLRTSTDSVTSTAISDVGWFLMVGAALFLAVWWVRNARHGRRAHRLVPRPDDEARPDDLRPDDLRPDELSSDVPSPDVPSPDDLPAPRRDPSPDVPSPASTGGPTLAGKGGPRPSATSASATSASATSAGVKSAGVKSAGVKSAGSEGRGAANPVGAAPHFALRTGRVGQPGKHAVRPPR